ncbi:predicted protein [Naegleria gruberi]|uniref:Predicted protein n=1 Tax=Naegleria gruberi TaxID=5762 RepID=D2VJZ9_NAEGR|nr:uncharacterized protein NAEGRDRAFT_69219 [Naegleria gruberi]EFC42776.1 predicted protein [Naegleria gruberi]|eukprot:XP_002675520.1 predicted protein [Naegleria gruberi strain NEG-M]
MSTNTTTWQSSTNKQQYKHLHRSATQIQSQWRGHKTRKQITDWAMKEFENIVMEIEGKDSEISWNSSNEDENDLDRILSNFVNRNDASPSSSSNEPSNQPIFMKNAQKLFEEKLKEAFQEPSVQTPEPQTLNTGMNTSVMNIPKITKEQEIQTETLRTSIISKEPLQAITPQNRRLVTVSTNTSIAFDGIPKIQEQKTQDLSIEIPLEDTSSVQSQEDLSDMLDESAIMMSNLDMLKSFDFSEMKKSSDSTISTQAPTKSKEPFMPQQPIQSKQNVSNDFSTTRLKQSQEIPPSKNNSILSNNNTTNNSIKSNLTASVNQTTPSPSSSQTSEKLQQQQKQAKQELQQQMNMLRYEIQLAEEAYSRRKKELVEERKRHIR